MNCFFVLHSYKLVVYVNNQILRIYKKFFGYLSQHTNVLNDKGNQHKKFFGHLLYFVFSEGGCYIVQSQNLYYQKNMLCNYPSPVKTLLLLYCTHYTSCCALEPLLIFGMLSNMMSQSVLNIYQHVLLKQLKTCYPYHYFHLC